MKKNKIKNCPDSLNIYTTTIEEIVEKWFSSNGKSERYSYLFKESEGADAPALVVNEDEIRKINTSQKAL